jgi:rhomboid protease GluP
MYIFCCTQGIDKSNYEVLEISQKVLIDYGGALGSLVKDGELYRLITASFLHANLMHIVMNSISLLFLATRFEKIYPKSTPLILLTSSITGKP